MKIMYIIFWRYNYIIHFSSWNSKTNQVSTELTNESLSRLFFLQRHLSTDDSSRPIKDTVSSDSWGWLAAKEWKKFWAGGAGPEPKSLATTTERTVMFLGRRTEMKFRWFSCSNSRTYVHIHRAAVNPPEKWSAPLLSPVRAPHPFHPFGLPRPTSARPVRVREADPFLLAQRFLGFPAIGGTSSFSSFIKI